MDILNQDASTLAQMISDNQLGVAELAQETLAQIGRTNGPVNAIVAAVSEDDVLAEARRMDDARATGQGAGRLYGLPIAVKVLANVTGLPSTKGSPLFRDVVAPADDIMVARLRAAGVLFVGKTNTPEFGLGSHTFNPVYGATHNPYDLGRSAGGSSGGAAAALACRMLPLADGSDMMGSLRNPAGWNNVYGMRPSWGRIPAEPLGDAFMHPLATLGPMARSPRDLALMLEVQSGPDPRQPFAPPIVPLCSALDRPVKGRRIGWLADWGGAYTMEPGILPLSETALKTFGDLGVTVEPVAPPMPAEALWEAWVGLRAFANVERLGPLYADPAKRAQLKDSAIWEVEQGLALSGQEIQRLSLIRSDWFRRAAALFADYDALVLPSAQMWPFAVETTYPTAVSGTAMDTYHRWMEVVVPVSLIGLPCVNVPAGFGAQGLPAGLQIFGRYGDDLGVLQLAHAYHQATDWPNARPPACAKA
jgi:amidase